MTNSISRIAICVALVAAAMGCERAPTSADVEATSSALTVSALQVNCGGAAVGTFAADTGSSGGATLTRANTIDLSGVVNAAPAAVYQSQRYNNMSYAFSGFVPGSNNDIRLHWADTKWTTSNQRLFNVTINGTRVLTNFDVIGAAGAANKAVARTFTVAADATGAYTIQFVGTKDAAMVSAIEIGQQIVGAFVHVNAGGPATGAFVADRSFTGGSTMTRANAINLTGVTNPAPVAVYQSQRYGAGMSYHFPGFPAGGRNLVRLHFADTKDTTAGARLFNVAINGAQMLTSFDVVAAAGAGNKAVVKEFQAAADATGAYGLTFGAVKDDPMISGIEIVPLCSSVTLTTASAGATPTSKVQLTGAATCAAGVTPEYHFAFRDPSSADDSWHDITPSFGGPTLVWDTNWKSTTPMGSSYQIEVLARAVNNDNGGEAEAVGTLTLTSASQVGSSATCASSSACDDGVVTTVDTCSAGHCGIEPGAHGTQTVPGYALPPTAATMTPVDPATPVSINVGLPLRATTQTLQARVDAISDPQSPFYRQYLSASDLAAYLPAPTDASTIVSWAQARQLTAALNAGTPMVTVSGTAAQIQKALYVHLVSGPRADGTTFFGPDRVPSIDVALTLLGVSNLDDYVQSTPLDAGGTGYAPPSTGVASFDSTDVRNAYLGGAGSSCAALRGGGQSVGLIAFAGFNSPDIAAYATKYGFPSYKPIQVVLGQNTTPCTGFGCDGQQAFTYVAYGNDEISLDIEAALSMAPDAQIVVFQSNQGSFDASFAKMIANPQIHQLSSSWVIPASTITPALFTIMAAQGQTFFTGSGDDGNLDHIAVNVSPTNPKGTCELSPTTVPPYTVMVGGTNLNMTGGAYFDEGIYTGSGGGVLTSMPIPTWQQGINPGNAEVSSLYRNIPDVSLPGQNFDIIASGCNGVFIGDKPANPADCNTGYIVCGPGAVNPATGMAPNVVKSCTQPGVTQIERPVGGTSIAGPMWAGFMALVNQSNTSQGLPLVGFADPTFYAIGRDPAQYAASFNDVVWDTAERADCSGVGHLAVEGYDLVTGLGSPTCGLISKLAHPTATLGITVHATGSATVTGPVTLTGTGFGFTPDDSVGFTLAGVPGGGGTNLPEREYGDDVQTDDNGNITFSLTGTFLPAAVLCTPAQEQATVTLIAHDRGAEAQGHEVTATATFPASLFCAEIIAPHTDVNAALNDPVLVQDFFPGHPGGLADDGDPTTYWGSTDFELQDFITIDLTAPRLIHGVSIIWGPSLFASAYQIQTSNDNSTWTTIGTFTLTFGGTEVDLTSVNVTARYVRVLMTQSSEPQLGAFSVPEIQVHGQMTP